MYEYWVPPNIHTSSSSGRQLRPSSEEGRGWKSGYRGRLHNLCKLADLIELAGRCRGVSFQFRRYASCPCCRHSRGPRLSPHVPLSSSFFVDRRASCAAPFRDDRLVGKLKDSGGDAAVNRCHVREIDLLQFVAQGVIIRVLESDRDGVCDDAELRKSVLSLRSKKSSASFLL